MSRSRDSRDSRCGEDIYSQSDQKPSTLVRKPSGHVMKLKDQQRNSSNERQGA
jgi:hypothetical protein